MLAPREVVLMRLGHVAAIALIAVGEEGAEKGTGTWRDCEVGSRGVDGVSRVGARSGARDEWRRGG